ncbi:hypothetical protein ELI54_32225 [Rhizobium ruizarguesonis]|uniref:hypothetical protein n=1 Tax=Rhizobium ruizarguesonis TaxID=2081791 RepID=UPI001031C0F4|nr:hypothetical protein [Rhizobium ruizarguesonis]MBY5886050.1 hypothetical protein [Rhizobium leguminosarum]QSZ03952.1 hypothetical protein J3P73_25385 [Rhizobium ruizarguesonis]TAT73820.1 hypothetical protein ELI56_29045 [Rhizobium ruizarguesonis]TAT74289.1 hypothetical protein ELI54_32225 [Rhizobium ruizarguesonis]TAZ66075.1 hypothetical protein ELH70_34530 [Rhizobium ruizarguesonis]
MPKKAITKLADLPPITNDGDNIRPSAPPHADVVAGLQLFAPSFEASAFGLQNSGRRTNRYSLDGQTIDAAQADRIMDSPPSRATLSSFIRRRSQGPRRAGLPPRPIN